MTPSQIGGLFVGMAIHGVGLYAGGVLGNEYVTNVYTAFTILMSMLITVLFALISLGIIASDDGETKYEELIKLRDARNTGMFLWMSRFVVTCAIVGQAALGWYWTMAFVITLQIASYVKITIEDNAIARLADDDEFANELEA